MASLAAILLEAGATETSRMKDFIEEIGKRFEFHRRSFNPDLVRNASNALDRLYAFFAVPPVPHRLEHDGKARIVVKASAWQTQHRELWELLVPSNGQAATIQGEVIRISGRIANEIENNGGVNWDSDYHKMGDAFVEYIEVGHSLSSSDRADAATIIQEVKHRFGDTARLCELAVNWVLQNPMPFKLETRPNYER